MFEPVKKNHRLLFYAAWLIINIIQASNTQLLDDEAYYWVYSRFLDWGYFDHPPMVALLIKAGYSIFHNELGVRLLFVLLNTATIYSIQLLLDKKNDFLFYGIALSIAIAQIGGIFAAPDIPLLFFAALFFLLYRRFVQNSSLLNTFLLGACAALLLYSKYQGVLVILFTLLSNLKLFSKYHTYVAGAVALVLFMPHLYWQYTHGFPSVLYHLFDRNASGYKIMFTVEYLAGQLGITGPIAGWLLLWCAFRYKPVTATERALKFSLMGTFIFFGISTFKGRVEANWTVAALIPLMVLSHQYLVQKSTLRLWLFRSVPVTFSLVLGARFYMMLNKPPDWAMGRKELFQNNVWTDSIQQKASQLPVAFINSYQKASKYWFYANKPAFSLNTTYYRLNNYNFWPLEDSLLGKPVYIPIGEPGNFLLNVFRQQNWQYPAGGIIPGYYSFSKVCFASFKSNTTKSGKRVLAFSAFTPDNYLPLFQQDQYKATAILLTIYRQGDAKEFIPTGLTVKDITECEQRFTITLPGNLPPGDFTARLSIESCLQGFPTANSILFTVNAESMALK